MTLVEFLATLRQLDIQLWVDDEQLHYSAPTGTLTSDLRAELLARKREITAFLQEAHSMPLSVPPTIKPRSAVNTYEPLSFTQQRLWFLHQLEPTSSAYHIPALFHLTGALNIAGLEASFQRLIARHESLRTTFPTQAGQPYQYIVPTRSFHLPVVDLRELPSMAQEEQITQLSSRVNKRPFDLAQGPLLRVTLFHLGVAKYTLFFTIHHLIADGWSVAIIMRELEAFYNAYPDQTPAALPPLPIQYADYVHWQQKQLQGELLQQHLAYWAQKLAPPLPSIQLPRDWSRSQNSYKSGRYTAKLPTSLSNSLADLSTKADVTLFVTLLAAFNVLLYQQTGQTDIRVGIPIANRNHADIEPLIGCFVNTLVLRHQLTPNQSFCTLLAQVQQTAFEAYDHQDIPFAKLVQEHQPERNTYQSPFFNIFFNMVNVPSASINLLDVTVEIMSIDEPSAKFDLTIYIRETDKQFVVDWVYNANLYTPARIAELMAQYQTLLMHIAADPEAKLTHFSSLTPAAKQIIPDPTAPLSEIWTESVHALFSTCAEKYPHHIALDDGKEQWTYAQLEAKSNQLAHYLVDMGIQPEEVIAIYGQRSMALVWAVLGILKAGASFLILEPAYPTTRLINYLQLAKPKGWLQIIAEQLPPPALTEYVESLACRCQITWQLFAGSEMDTSWQSYKTTPLGLTSAPNAQAYLMFTSGSTGQPKGIVSSHKVLPHFLQWHIKTFELKSTDKFSMLSGLSHDPLMRDMFTPLLLGATLAIPSRETFGSAENLLRWLQEKGISVLHLTPTMGKFLAQAVTSMQAETTLLSQLRYAFLGGETLTATVVSLLYQFAPNITCVNFYGATETPQAMGYFVLPKGYDFSAGVPIGQGIEDVQLLILNPAGHLAGIGELGEIYIRTPYLATRYLDEGLTQAAFLTNPFTQLPQDRLYRTGDNGRYQPDGNIMFEGRADHQIKLRGFRIEPGEIEKALERHFLVQQALVTLWSDNEKQEEPRLVAYLVCQPEATPSTTELQQHLRTHLPEYMVPALFVHLNHFPQTPNGKIDRHNLPDPELDRPDLDTDYVVPRTEIEEKLTSIWCDVLGINCIGIHDNFFELGGHSLLATLIAYRIRETWHIEVPLQAFFEQPTIANLATVIAAGQKDTTASAIIQAMPRGRKNLNQLLTKLDRISQKKE